MHGIYSTTVTGICGEAAVCLGPTQVSGNAGFSWPP